MKYHIKSIKAETLSKVLQPQDESQDLQRTHKAETIADLFPGYSSTGRHRIFVNENLTAVRRSLIEAANKRRKDGSLSSVWSLDGKVYVKSTPEGSPIRILTEQDLNDI